MSDDADRADSRIEDMIEDNLAAIRRRMEYREIKPCGTCYFCREDVDGARLFCSLRCSDDYELRKRNGQ